MGTSARLDPLDAAWEAAQSGSSTADPLDAVWEARQPRTFPRQMFPSESTRQTGGVQSNPQATHLPEPIRSVTDFLVNPAMENPLTTAVAGILPPVGAYMAAQGVRRVVDYGAQKAAEMTLPTDTRKFAEADPDRIEGREAATLAGAFAAAPLIHGGVRALKRAPIAEVATPPVEAPAMPSPRVPSSLAEARLARAYKPQEIDAPVSTGVARDRVAQLDAVLEPNRVNPTEAAPATTEVFPEGYSTKSTRVGRRPGAAVEAPKVDPLDVVWEEAQAVEPPVVKPPEPIPTIGEPVSFGRDLVRTGGKEPTTNTGVVFPDETASVGAVEPAPKSPMEVPSAFKVRWRDEPTAKPSKAPLAPSAEDAFLRDDAGSIAPVEGTGQTQVRGLSLGVEDKAIENRLTTSLGELPEYNTLSMADQASKASKLLAEDAGLAHRIAIGEVPPPADLLPESVFVAVENRAIANGDVATLRSLAAGRLTTEATTMGQRIRTLAERDPDSPVGAMQKIVEARTKGVKDAKAATEIQVQELQRHIADAVKMDPPAWQSFIDSIRC